MNYNDALHWLYSMQSLGIKLGLNNMRRLVAALEIDVEAGRAQKIFHVAGTNGKGSTCAMLDSICRAAGKKVGLYTSPHLINFLERIRVNGDFISQERTAEILTRIRGIVESWKEKPTFFEIATALALLHFQIERCEVLIIETGLGGRLDATNVLHPTVSIITKIGYDHQQHLGNHIAEIAYEKAGIIKPGVPVVTIPQESDEAMVILVQVAMHRGAYFHLAAAPVRGVRIGLGGAHQRWNAALALHAIDVAGMNDSPVALQVGLAEVQWPGRFQRIGHIVLDGAHNAQAAETLAHTWRSEFGDDKAVIILGILADKDARGIVQALLPIAKKIIVVPVKSPRSMAAPGLERIIKETAPDLPVEISLDLTKSVDAAGADRDRILITGSFFLIGEALQALVIDAIPDPISAQ